MYWKKRITPFILNYIKNFIKKINESIDNDIDINIVRDLVHYFIDMKNQLFNRRNAKLI